MYYQKALVHVMKIYQISILELAKKMGSDPRWVAEITSNSEWRPKLDTIFRICYTLRFDVIKFVNYAEFGVYINESENLSDMMGTNANSSLSKLTVAIQQRLVLNILPEHIAHAFRSFRIERKLTQRNLETITSFSVNTICHRESMNYRNYPTVTTLETYCDAFGISMAEFLLRAFSYIEKVA